jgi:rubrerythrin
MSNKTSQKKPEQTLKNLEAAFAGEAMAYQKYLYFARVARRHGDEETAAHFEEIARQETSHARGHLELLFPPETLDPRRVLELAIEGETHEYTEMYPAFRTTALEEGALAAAGEFDEQIEESKEHAGGFARMLEKAEKRFKGLGVIEERHAKRYEARLAELDAQDVDADVVAGGPEEDEHVPQLVEAKVA